MSDEKIRKVLQEAGITETITCPEALALARKAGVAPGDVGGFCTKNRIKIRGCQLGCFK